MELLITQFRVWGSWTWGLGFNLGVEGVGVPGFRR